MAKFPFKLSVLAICLLVHAFAACGADTGCTSISGTCQEDYLACSGRYESNLCSGQASRRCCLSAGADTECTSISGSCQQETMYCSDGYVSGLCSGSSSRKCCVPAGSGGCSSVTIISRAQWGARNPTQVSTMQVPVSKFFIHHTGGASCTSITECSARVRGIQNYHMDSRNWSDIGYSFLVGEDGNVYEGRGWTHVGAHTHGYNSIAFAASMIGS